MTATKTEAVSILIFAAREDAADGYGRSRVLYDELVAANLGIPIQFIDRMASELASLTLVAKHRVVLSPCLLILRKGKAIARRLGVPSVDDVLGYVEAMRL